MTFRYTRNGALRFLRVGRVQLSWCICKPAKRETRRPIHDGTLAVDGLLAAFALPVVLRLAGLL